MTQKEAISDVMYLIDRLRGIEVKDTNNLMKILLIMIRLKSEDDFLHFLFEIVDQNLYIQVIAGEYDHFSINDSPTFDELVELLHTVGNEVFEIMANDFYEEYKEMILNLVSALMVSRLYFKIDHTDTYHYNVEMAEKNS